MFFRYALPCARTLVKRGKITQQLLDQMISRLSNGEELPEGFEDNFVVAKAMCTVIARKMGKAEIDEEVLRQYYIIDHCKVVKERYEQMKDFDPAMCNTKIGEVARISDYAVVKTKLGLHKYRTDFFNNLKVGDKVVVHYNFVSDRLTDGQAKIILNKKPIL